MSEDAILNRLKSIKELTNSRRLNNSLNQFSSTRAPTDSNNDFNFSDLFSVPSQRSSKTNNTKNDSGIFVVSDYKPYSDVLKKQMQVRADDRVFNEIAGSLITAVNSSNTPGFPSPNTSPQRYIGDEIPLSELLTKDNESNFSSKRSAVSSSRNLILPSNAPADLMSKLASITSSTKQPISSKTQNSEPSHSLLSSFNLKVSDSKVNGSSIVDDLFGVLGKSQYLSNSSNVQEVNVSSNKKKNVSTSSNITDFTADNLQDSTVFNNSAQSLQPKLNRTIQKSPNHFSHKSLEPYSITSLSKSRHQKIPSNAPPVSPENPQSPLPSTDIVYNSSVVRLSSSPSAQSPPLKIEPQLKKKKTHASKSIRPENKNQSPDPLYRAPDFVVHPQASTPLPKTKNKTPVSEPSSPDESSAVALKTSASKAVSIRTAAAPVASPPRDLISMLLPAALPSRKDKLELALKSLQDQKKYLLALRKECLSFRKREWLPFEAALLTIGAKLTVERSTRIKMLREVLRDVKNTGVDVERTKKEIRTYLNALGGHVAAALGGLHTLLLRHLKEIEHARQLEMNLAAPDLQLRHLTEKLNVAQSTIEDLSCQVQRKSEKCVVLNDELNESQSSNLRLEKRKNFLEDALESTQKELQSLRIEFERVSSDLKERKSETNSMGELIRETTDENSRLHAQLASQAITLTDVTARLRETDVTLSSRTELLENSRTEREELKIELARVREQSERLRKDVFGEREGLVDQNVKLLQSLAQRDEELRTMRDQFDLMRQDLNHARSQMDEKIQHEISRNQAHVRVTRQLDEREEELSTIDEERRRLQLKLRTIEDENVVLRQAESALRTNLTETQAKLSRDLTLKESMDAEVKRLRVKYAQTVSRTHRLEQRIASLSSIQQPHARHQLQSKAGVEDKGAGEDSSQVKNRMSPSPLKVISSTSPPLPSSNFKHPKKNLKYSNSTHPRHLKSSLSTTSISKTPTKVLQNVNASNTKHKTPSDADATKSTATHKDINNKNTESMKLDSFWSGGEESGDGLYSPEKENEDLLTPYIIKSSVDSPSKHCKDNSATPVTRISNTHAQSGRSLSGGGTRIRKLSNIPSELVASKPNSMGTSLRTHRVLETNSKRNSIKAPQSERDISNITVDGLSWFQDLWGKLQ